MAAEAEMTIATAARGNVETFTISFSIVIEIGQETIRGARR
jgi:hypothetical protein